MRDARGPLLPILIYIQTHLEADLSLAALAARAELSPWHFHRRFRDEIGETPRQYVERLRLEQAALRLWLLRSSVLDVAISLGFESHETFTRAFRRRYGIVPSAVRDQGIDVLLRTDQRESAASAIDPGPGYHLSSTRLVTLEPMHLAFLRHVGPYEDVPDSLFADLASWVQENGLSGRPFMGIGHDAPGLTPPKKLRFDAAVKIDTALEPAGPVGYQTLDVGRCAVTTHVGSYTTLSSAYRVLFDRVSALRGFGFKGPPAVEIYHESRIDTSLSLNHTDIYLPVVREPHSRSAPKS